MMTTRTDSTAQPKKRSSISLVFTTVILVLAAVALVILVAQNTDQVEIGFLGWEFAFPLSVGLLVAAAGGAVVAFGIATLIAIRRKLN